MNSLFADTFFFIALLAPDDDAHGDAQEIVSTLSSRLITTSWVLMEVGDALAALNTRQAFGRLLDFLKNHPLVSVLPPNESQFSKAVELYRQRGDKAWSLTDCTSFVVMTDMEITEALTGDHHFEQTGFVPLLK